MRPLAGADGEQVNWLNYKTGIKHIYFRLDADKHQASVAIELKHPDTGIQMLQFGQFLSLKKILENETAEIWTWEHGATDEDGQEYCRIFTKLEGVNVLKTEDWPAIISFFKPRIVALDNFWNLVKDGFSN